MSLDGERLNVLLGVLGAVGNLLYVRFIFRQPARSPLDRRIVFLLACLTGTFLDRVVFWVAGTGPWHTLAMIPATGIPLSTALFIEGLRRRHLPLPIKAGVALGSVVAVTMNLVMVYDKREFFSFFSNFTILTFAVLVAWLVMRPRADLSAAENRLVDAIAVACALGVMFAMTDFEIRPDWLPWQLGGIGALVFVFSCVRLTIDREGQRTVAVDLARAVVYALGVTAGFAFFVPEAGAVLDRAVGLAAFAFILLFNIVARLRELGDRNASGTSFDHWLLRADLSTMESLIASLDDVPWTARPLVVRGTAIGAYDFSAIAALFDDEHALWSRAALRRAVAEPEGVSLDGAEQLLDLLVSRDVTHAALLRASPPVLLCLKLPDLAGQHVVAVELAVLQRIARLLPDVGLHHAGA